MDGAIGLGLPPLAFARQDEGADLDFYAPPRLVKHIDEAAVDALTVRYAEILRPGDRVLDLMSSWVSHLPGDIDLDVVGHGMNAHELAANSRFARWFVQDLNRDPGLPEPDAAFDAAFVCVGVQYLQRPLEVFLRRCQTYAAWLLSVGGGWTFSSNQLCFPSYQCCASARSFAGVNVVCLPMSSQMGKELGASTLCHVALTAPDRIIVNPIHQMPGLNT